MVSISPFLSLFHCFPNLSPRLRASVPGFSPPRVSVAPTSPCFESACLCPPHTSSPTDSPHACFSHSALPLLTPSTALHAQVGALLSPSLCWTFMLSLSLLSLPQSRPPALSSLCLILSLCPSPCLAPSFTHSLCPGPSPPFSMAPIQHTLCGLWEGGPVLGCHPSPHIGGVMITEPPKGGTSASLARDVLRTWTTGSSTVTHSVTL